MNLSVLSESSVSNSTNRIPNSKYSDSFFTEALNGINEIRRTNMTITQEFYKGLLEAGESPALVLEASDGLADGIKGIIDRFLALIKKLVAKFVTALHKLVKSDKYIKKNKEKFRKFNSDNEFEMAIYTYTYIDNNTFPNVSAYKVYQSQTFTPDTVKPYDDVVKYTADVHTNFVDALPDWYDKFRGVVLTNSNDAQAITSANSYTSAEYADELRRKYRNDDDSRTITTITSVEVLTALDRFLNYDKTVRNVEKLRDDLQREYKAIQKDIKSLTAAYSLDASTGASGWTYDYANNKYYDAKGGPDKLKDEYEKDPAKKKKADENIAALIKSKANQVDQMCTIHSMAFSAKLDAIKEAYQQDKKLLYKALQKINKTMDFRNESYIRDEVIPTIL